MSLDIIIERVRETPELWDVSHKHYKNRRTIKKFWTNLAQELRCKEEHVKKRWKHLKDQYRKELKKIIMQNNGQIPADDECKSVWQWFDLLSFMKSEVLHKDGLRPIKRDDSSTEEEDQPLVKKRKTDFEVPRLDEEHHPVDLGAMDPDYMFLMSLLPSMKSLNDIQKLQLRGKINEWLLQAITQNQDDNFESKFHLSQHLTG